jgi:hypothetical protein
VPRDLGHQRQHHLAVDAEILVERLRQRAIGIIRLERLDAGAPLRGLGMVHHVDGKQKAIAGIGGGQGG